MLEAIKMKIIKLIALWLIWFFGLTLIASISSERKIITPITIYIVGSLTIFLIINFIKAALFIEKITKEYVDKPINQRDKPEETMEYFYKEVIPLCIKKRRLDLAKEFYAKMLEFDPQSKYVKKLYEKYPLLEMK